MLFSVHKTKQSALGMAKMLKKKTTLKIKNFMISKKKTPDGKLMWHLYVTLKK